MIDPPVSRFYRIIEGELATEADFEPYAAQGRPAPTDPYLRRLWQGISVYDSLERAISQARRRPGLGAYVAELEIPWGRNIQAERTGHRRGHHTLWGNQRCFLRVLSVSCLSCDEDARMRYYEVWDQRGRNLLGSYGAEWEALALVRGLDSESAPVDALALIWGDEDDEDLGGQIVEGPALLARARAAQTHTA